MGLPTNYAEKCDTMDVEYGDYIEELGITHLEGFGITGLTLVTQKGRQHFIGGMFAPTVSWKFD